LILVALAFETSGGGHGHMDAQGAAVLFVQEAFGGAVMGLVLGWITYQVMRRIDDYAVEILLTLALVMGGYLISLKLHLSAPIMAVMAGLLIGHVGMPGGMSENTRTHVDAFWRVVDEILNMILFVMIGVEVFAITFDQNILLLGLGGIALSLLGRTIAVAVPFFALKPFRTFSKGAFPLLTWGGIKGGISIALALSLPDGPYSDVILGVTYIVVIFSILVQGLTIAPLARKVT
jgi:CPA1 family monovalent cation:H+ antiporter